MDVKASRRYARKNVYGLSAAFVVNFSAFWALQNIQSSISGDLGLISLAVTYFSFALACFVAPGIIKLIGTKYSIAAGFACHLVYTLCNYHPDCFTLIPGSVIIGFAAAPIWASVGSHLTEVAKSVAPVLGKGRDYLISKYTGIFFFFFPLTAIPGNLASSLIFFPYGSSVEQNYSFSGDSSNVSEFDNDSSSAICGNVETAAAGILYQRYGFVSVGVFFNITGFLILMLFVDHLPNERKFFSAERKFQLYIQEPFVGLLKVLRHKHMLLIGPLALYSGMEMSFAFGTFTKIYISDSFGIYLVGFAIILFGISSAVVSIAYSKLVKHIPIFAFALFGAFLSIGVILFLLIWERVPSYAVIFSFAVVWGVTDAVWNTVSLSLTGILFAESTEAGYSAFRIWQSSGFCIGFIAPLLKPAERRFEAAVPLALLLFTVIVASVCVLVIQFTTPARQQLCACHRSNDLDIVTPKEGEKNADETSQKPSVENINLVAISYQGKRPSIWSAESGDVSSSLTVDGTLVPVAEDSVANGDDSVADGEMHKNERSFISLLQRSDSYEDAMKDIHRK